MGLEDSVQHGARSVPIWDVKWMCPLSPLRPTQKHDDEFGRLPGGEEGYLQEGGGIDRGRVNDKQEERGVLNFSVPCAI